MPLFYRNIRSRAVRRRLAFRLVKIPLKEAMARVEKASGYLFSYDATEINAEQLVKSELQEMKKCVWRFQ